MQHIRIDRSRALTEEPDTGHNRWHPDIPPLVEVDEGEEVVLETRDASDGFVVRGLPASLPPATGGRVHPLTGPVYVKDGEPGDLLDCLLYTSPSPRD